MHITKYIPGIVLAVVFLIAFSVVGVSVASITYQNPVQRDRVLAHTFLSATTTSATSTSETRIPANQTLRIEGAKKVTALFTHGGVATTSTGGAKFNLEVSTDGTTWHAFNKLVGADVSSTATSTVTIQGATSTVVVSMNLVNDTYRFMRCIVNELNAPLGVDGESTCAAFAEF